MELDVLSRGQVRDAARVSVSDVGDPAKLGRGHPAERDLDAHHLDAVLALAIDAVLQPKSSEYFCVDLPAEEALGFLLVV
jgi:hypothetical protein